MSLGSSAALSALELGEFGPSFAAAMAARVSFVAITAPAALAVFATRSSSGVPQIVEMVNSKSPEKVADKWGARVFYGDAVVYLSRAAYHVRKGYHVSTWSELIPLTLQNLLCFAVVRSAKTERPRLEFTLDAALLCALGALMASLPARLLPALCLWSVPLSLCSYGVQVVEASRMGSARSRKRASQVRLRWLGSLIRVATTARFLAGDRAAMASHVVGFVGCSVLLLQRSLFMRDGPTKFQTRRALYAQLVGVGRRSPHQLPLAIDRPLHAWRSLGGLGAAAPPALADMLLDRRSFDAIDEDGDGTISSDELTAAVLKGRPTLSRADATPIVARMIELADADGDGRIDFDEFKAIVERAGAERGAEEELPPQAW